MKKILYVIFLFVSLISCKDDDINLFEKTPAERSAEAINNLKSKLTAPENGWRLKYKPVDEAGAYWVLMKFNDDNTVSIRTDLPADDGKYFNDTVTFRIDNSVTLELIFENYTFFSYLFEQDQAQFGAEFMFHYQAETEGNLVFVSKSDLTSPTVALFEMAGPNDEALLGQDIAADLGVLQGDVGNLTTTFKLTYENKDVVLQISMDNLRRIININAATRKSDNQQVQFLNFSSGFFVTGDSIVFNNTFSESIFQTAVTLSGLSISQISESSIDLCGDMKTSHILSGTTSQGDNVTLETTLQDFKSPRFATLSDFYFSPIGFVLNGERETVVFEDVQGVLEMHLYYNFGDITAVGFVLQKTDGSYYFALQQFTPSLEGNKLTFDLNPEISLYNTDTAEADLDIIRGYIDKLTQGGSAYVFEYADNIFEFYNPCSGWSFVFVNANS